MSSDTRAPRPAMHAVGPVARATALGLSAILLLAAAPVAAAGPRLSREQQEDLARLFWIWGPGRREQALSASPTPTPSPVVGPSSVSGPGCEVEVLSASAYRLPATEHARILYLGLTSEVLPKSERQAAEELFGARLEISAPAELTSFRDVEALLEVETARDVLGCDDASCMGEIGGAMGATALVRGSVSKLDGDLVVSGRVVDAASARVLGKTVVRTEGLPCLSAAIQRAGTLLFQADHE